jgi:hypothetical protein
MIKLLFDQLSSSEASLHFFRMKVPKKSFRMKKVFFKLFRQTMIQLVRKNNTSLAAEKELGRTIGLPVCENGKVGKWWNCNWHY